MHFKIMWEHNGFKCLQKVHNNSCAKEWNYKHKKWCIMAGRRLVIYRVFFKSDDNGRKEDEEKDGYRERRLRLF